MQASRATPIGGIKRVWRANSHAERLVEHELAEELGLQKEELIPYGKRLGKIDFTQTMRRIKDKPRGKYVINVCSGTACHVKGAQRLVSRLETELGVSVGETTPDGQFTLEEVRCLGCCGLAPVATVGEELFGKINPGEAAGIVKKYSE